MFAKLDRLRQLHDLVPNVPRTYSGAELVQRPECLESDGASHWYLRPTDDDVTARHGFGERILTTAEVSVRLAELSKAPGVLIQEYIAPSLSGVAFIANQFLVVECVAGACGLLLRGGATGDRMVFDSNGQELWRQLNSSVPVRLIEQAAKMRELAEMLRAQQRSAIVEWIVNANGGFYFVDFKPVEQNYICSDLRVKPTRFCLDREAAPDLCLDATLATHLETILRSSPKCVLFSRGSPLAHVCVEAVGRGIAVVVENEPETSAQQPDV